jgi:hypothetical protein
VSPKFRAKSVRRAKSLFAPGWKKFEPSAIVDNDYNSMGSTEFVPVSLAVLLRIYSSRLVECILMAANGGWDCKAISCPSYGLGRQKRVGYLSFFNCLLRIFQTSMQCR